MTDSPCAGAARDALRADIARIELRENDIGGIAVHIGQRVSARAAPGEVLVTRTVTDLVVGAGREFDDRGDHELSGIPGSWHLLAVRS